MQLLGPLPASLCPARQPVLSFLISPHLPPPFAQNMIELATLKRANDDIQAAANEVHEVRAGRPGRAAGR